MAVIDVIKYNGGHDVFAWKFPNEELGTWTQLIVNESQEAILFKGGQALDVFGPGRHTLSTSNIPVLNRLVNLPFGGRSPFTAEVWYVNKIHSLDVKWGTPTPIQLQDPEYQIFVPVRAFGQFGIQITETKKFITKLVGTMPVLDKENITNFFRGLYLTKAKDAIATYVVKKGISLLRINASLSEISYFLQRVMQPLFEGYGISLLNFNVNDINVPEDDPAVVQLKAALAKRAEMNILGYNYVQERSFDTLEGAAVNPGAAGGVMSSAMGLAMGVQMGGAMGNQVGNLAQGINPNPTKKCSKCSGDIDVSVKFCPLCGNDTTAMPVAPPSAESKSCHKCSAVYQAKYKFCPECGEPSERKCGGCNSPVEGSPKFCPECGHKL